MAEYGVLDLNSGNILPGSKLIERGQEGMRVEAGVHHRSHEVGAPALERASQNPERALGERAGAKIADRVSPFTDRPLPNLHALALGEVVEPDLTMEQVCTFVIGDTRIPS